MDATYYQEYFDLERKHWWFRARKEIIRGHLSKILPKNKSLNILNIGVSTGHSSEMLSEFGEVTSIEYDKDCIEFTKTKIDLPILEGSILELPFEDKTFDVVCAFDVIEHVENDQKAIDEMIRVSKIGATLMVTVPAFMFLWSPHDEVNHHFRRYHKKQLMNLFPNKKNFIFHSYFNFWTFFLIAPIRLLINLFPKSIDKREGSGSDFSSPLGAHPWIQKILYTVFKSELFFLNKGISFPFGISILSSWKNEKPTS